VTTPFDPNRPLTEVEFAVFDVETTGLSAAVGHRVCEVACVRARAGVELDRFDSLVDPGRAISAGAYRVNRISPAMLAGAPPFAQIAPALLARLEGAVLVAHNAPFDLSFLAAELDFAGLPPPEGPVVDTLTLVRRIHHFPSNSLGVVAAALEVPTIPSHRALSDVQATWEVLERLLWDLDHRWGVATLEQLLDFQGGPVPYPARRPPAADLPLPPAMAEALEGGKRVRMHYVNYSGQESHRVVKPIRVSESRGILYLQAHCYQAGELRTFRLDRVVDMVLEE
jgi:DNA polymerase-3 subunit epsilon